MKEEKTNERLF